MRRNNRSIPIVNPKYHIYEASFFVSINLVPPGVQEEPDGDREEADAARGQGGGHDLQRRASHQDHRHLQPEQLPVHHQLWVVSAPPTAFRFICVRLFFWCISASLHLSLCIMRVWTTWQRSSGPDFPHCTYNQSIQMKSEIRYIHIFTLNKTLQGNLTLLKR